MNSVLSNLICILMAVCMLFTGIHIDLDHWNRYDRNSSKTLSDSYITSPDDYIEVVVAVQRLEKGNERLQVRLLLNRMVRKFFDPDLHAILPVNALFINHWIRQFFDYEWDAIATRCHMSVVMDYMHQQDGRKRN